MLFITSVSPPPKKKARGLMKKGIGFYDEVLIRRPHYIGRKSYNRFKYLAIV
jgi:hypothetical protein